MSAKHTKTLIIGGGISGLSTARQLSDSGDTDFIVVTKDIGGRIITSEDKAVNYGAYYVRNDYKHVLPFVNRGRRIHVPKMVAYCRGHRHSPTIKSLLHLPALVRGLFFLHKFNRRYAVLRKRMTTMSQKKAIEQDAWLRMLYDKPATELISELGIEHWEEHFLDTAIRATTFVHCRQMTAFGLAACALPIILPAHEFIFDWNRLTKPFKNNIEMNEITGLQYTAGKWHATTTSGQEYIADNIVLGLPIHLSKELITIEEPVNTAISAYMSHVRGVPKKTYGKESYQLLSPQGNDIVIANEADGTHLFYSLDKNVDLSQYFEEHELIAFHHWNPAFFIGPNLVETERGNNMFLIGDNNVGLMEDTFIHGVFAANKILGKA